MNIEIVAPSKSEDGIVFYVSADGSKTGISVSGLERLLGLQPTGQLLTGRSLILTDMANNAPRESVPKSLKATWGNVFTPHVKGSDGARIVSSKAASCVIKYYAFEKGSEKAMHSLDQFLDIGFETWVKEITNFTTSNQETELLEAVKQLIPEVKRLNAKAEKWDRIEGITATVYPGMHSLNQGFGIENDQLTLESKALYTAVEWLAMRGYVVDKSTKHAFCLQASDTYLTMTGKRPPDKYVTKHTRRGSRSVKVGKGYKMLDFHILEVAWNSMQNNKVA